MEYNYLRLQRELQGYRSSNLMRFSANLSIDSDDIGRKSKFRTENLKASQMDGKSSQANMNAPDQGPFQPNNEYG